MNSVRYEGAPDDFDFELYRAWKIANQIKRMAGEPYACGHLNGSCKKASAQTLSPEKESERQDSSEKVEDASNVPFSEFVLERRRKLEEGPWVTAYPSTMDEINAVYDPSAPDLNREGDEVLDHDEISDCSTDGDSE